MYGASSGSPLHAMGFGSSAYLHTLAEAMRGALADRVRFAGDPDADPGVTAAYTHALDPAQLSARRARIEPRRTHPTSEFRTREQGTTHVIVTDSEGNVVTLTTTINAPFGAQIVAGDTGVIMNDELDDFSSPQDIAGFGVIGLGPNRPRPGVRPVSSMTPTIAFEGGLPVLATGGSGGGRIATGVTQAVLGRFVFGLDPSACVSSPRIHVTGNTAELVIDTDIVEDVRAGLRERGESLKGRTLPARVHADGHVGPVQPTRSPSRGDRPKEGRACGSAVRSEPIRSRSLEPRAARSDPDRGRSPPRSQRHGSA
jgi:gamma-glutamyltranspeptidase/glutathione hydrolase